MFFGFCLALLIGVFGTYKFLEMKNAPKDDLISAEANNGTGEKRLVEGKPWTSPSCGIELVWCKPGSFMMGSKADETGRGSDEIHHRVSFSKGFLIGKYELTQQQYELVMGNNPSTFRGPNLPVEMVTWNQATEFL